MLKPLINSILLIFLGLSIGYLIQLIIKSEKYSFSMNIEKTRKTLQKIVILGLMPINYIGVYWAMDFSQKNLLLFPLLCVFQLILGGSIAILIAKSIHLKHMDAGAFFCCGFFCNLANVGGVICLITLGEEGYKLAAFYILFLQIAYYAIGFPTAKYYAMKIDGHEYGKNNLKSLFKDPFILVSLTSIIIGFTLNAFGLERPEFYRGIIKTLVPTSTTLLLISIGLAMKLNKVGNYLRHSLYIAGIKFMIVPAVMVSLGILMGYHRINDGLPLKVLLILSSAPVAFNSIIASSIYKLNLDLANSCWVITTTGLGLVLPVVFLLISLV